MDKNWPSVCIVAFVIMIALVIILPVALSEMRNVAHNAQQARQEINQFQKAAIHEGYATYDNLNNFMWVGDKPSKRGVVTIGVKSLVHYQKEAISHGFATYNKAGEFEWKEK